MSGSVAATPRRPLLGLLADAVGGAHSGLLGLPEWVDAGRLKAVSGLLGLPDIATTLDRMSYGEALTRGKGQTLRMKPETANALMAVAPVAARYPMEAAGLLSMGADAGLGRAMFVGARSKTWDKAAAEKAEKMLAGGADPRVVWKETGTFKGPDGALRQEIDDSGMTTIVPLRQWADRRDGKWMAPNVSTAWDAAKSQLTETAPVRVKRLFEHQELENAYPFGFTKSPDYMHQSITSLPVQILPEGGSSMGALSDDVLSLNAALTPRDAKSTVLHELQHAIQQREGWARGGSPGDRLVISDEKKLADVRKKLQALARKEFKLGHSTPETQAEFLALKDQEIALQVDPFEAYRRLAGEAEARATQARMPLNALQRRETFPLDSYDVPLDQLIVRRDGVPIK